MTRILKIRLPMIVLLAIYAGACANSPERSDPKDVMPIVYHPDYNITFFGLEKLHPFDSTKYGRIHDMLVVRKLIDPKKIHRPTLVTDKQLLRVHSQVYLDSLNDSKTVAHITEMSPLAKIPNRSLQKNLLRPKRLATGGTILATALAMVEGWAINLSGGYHHAKANSGEGFCVFADIPIAVQELWETSPELRVMIVDLDAHQGNGFESVFKDDERVTMYDIYNGHIYPGDSAAKAFIDHDHPIPSGTSDEEYLKLLKETLPKAIAEAKPELLIYNAGTDIFEKDPLGSLVISRQGIIERDAFVFKMAREAKVPIAMLLSGGYTKDTASIVADSIMNLKAKGLLSD